MKKSLIYALFFIATIGFAQENNPTYEKSGDLVKATYYHDNGLVSVQGFFKDKKLTGTWTSFNTAGNKTQIAYYEAGKKVGKWFIWGKESLKEINYSNNILVSVNHWKSESSVAVNN
jgi:antitoxin component YwqK of YwqJK toxin-antitoxin module